MKEEKQNLNFKPIILNVSVGVGGLLVIDLASAGNPLWPALGLMIIVLGEVFPLFDVIKKKSSTQYGLSSFLGGLFYLYPGMAIAAFGLSLQSLILTKDWLITTFTFVGVIPILLKYMQVNPWFIAASIAIEILLILHLRKELWTKISG